MATAHLHVTSRNAETRKLIVEMEDTHMRFVSFREGVRKAIQNYAPESEQYQRLQTSLDHLGGTIQHLHDAIEEALTIRFGKES